MSTADKQNRNPDHESTDSRVHPPRSAGRCRTCGLSFPHRTRRDGVNGRADEAVDEDDRGDDHAFDTLPDASDSSAGASGWRAAERLSSSASPRVAAKPVVVVVVYMPGASVDAVVRAGRGKGGISSGTRRLRPPQRCQRATRAADRRQDRVLPDPAVLVVKLPGIITATLGVTDRDTVAEAVTQARR